MDLIFNESECQILNFTDITTYEKLKQQEDINNLLKTLNRTVYHEMIAPLKANIDISARLFRKLTDQKLKQMAQTITVSSNMLMLHAQDLLDQRIIEKGNFVPTYTRGLVSEAITEIVEMFRLTLIETHLKVAYKNFAF